ncbi:MAG: VOC family protein [Marinovum sp.]|nr:VOC family protein [Marinovum sp.]
MAHLEHVNLTVTDAHATAAVLREIFGWHIRWEGKTTQGWDAVHVGSDGSYIAMFSAPNPENFLPDKYSAPGAMNHIGVVVDDLAVAETKVRAAGFSPHAHFDYEPGERFYFIGHDAVEYEVISYA